ncbi:MAG: HAD-IA family hydrolase [Bacteroidales bacterium]|nr:HAD-IA family hydrolase [Bacteroidales bacterium]MDT8431455.1 HAD-IA family hydrolase [Bacteroidales bacterium]
MKIAAVLFDMDGVLLESERFINEAGVLMFREKGYEVDPDDFLEFTGMGEDRYLGGVAEKNDIPFDREKDKARTYEIYGSLVMNNIDPLPGVRNFIHKCKTMGLKIAVATSADHVKMMINLKEIDIPVATFDATVNGLEIEHKKPAPDIFLKAAAKLDVDPKHCLVVEDAVSGVKAAKAAGARVLALTTTFSKEELSEADWIAKNLARAPAEVLLW